MNLSKLATLNELTYQINSQIDADRYEDDNYLHIRYYKRDLTDAEAVCYEMKNNNKIICFKGTDSTMDWKYDVNFIPFKVPNHSGNNYKLHRGFYMQFESLKEYIDQELQKKPLNIILTGHSLGAALATICALYIHIQFPDIHISQVITFASPRVLCEELGEFYNTELAEKSIRIVNASDPIPHLPPQGPIYQFKHVEGTLIKFRKGDITGDKKDGIIKGLCNGFRGLIAGGKSHYISEYVKMIERHPLFGKIVFFN